MDAKQTNDRVDRTAFSVVPLTEATNARDYWHGQSPEARLQHLLKLRKVNYGPAASGRLQRILEVVERPPS